MAKEQGYRARSAFKLIQLNKKFDFLSKSNVLIDLCAAPGGWLQVAAKYMPKQAIIVGLDLAPIKPIPGVVSFVEDITSEKCRSTLKSQLKHFKADTVLHDGAPNVGSNWIQDAFSQSELVLSSLKLAVSFLNPGGNFVTKVFRSKDYNKLLWVFQQLFQKVEATKPASSRNVSAEIFVVCQGFLAPKKIDPKFLDPKWVFKEVDEFQGLEDMDDKKRKERQSTILNDLLHPEKRHRHRDGYAEGATILYSPGSMTEFIESPSDHIVLLSKSSCLEFDKTELGEKLRDHPLTSVEIKECCKDLKVLGKKDFKTLLKWRESMRLDLGLEKSRKQKKEEAETAAKEKEEEEETPESLANKLLLETLSVDARIKKQKKKERERKAKTLLKMRLGMDTPVDIGIDASNFLGEEPEDFEVAGVGSGLFSLNRPKTESSMKATLVSNSGGESEDFSDSESDDDDIYLSSDEEAERKLRSREDDLNCLYEHFKLSQMERDPIARSRAEKKESKIKAKKNLKDQFDEWYGVEYDKKKQAAKKAEDGSVNSSGSEDNEGGSDEEDVLLTDSESENEDKVDKSKMSSRAKTFFDNPIFKSLDVQEGAEIVGDLKRKKSAPKSLFEKEMELMSSDEEDEEIRKMNSKKKKKTVVVEESSNKKNDFEVVAKGPEFTNIENSDDEEEFLIKTAQDYTLAQQLIHPSGKRDLIDDAFNRYTFNDDDCVPSWFLEDESRHNKIHIPVTKEAVQAMKERYKELNDRPIKKVAEAKFRKQFRAQKRAEKFLEKANNMAEDEDMPDHAKAKNIVKLMAKAGAKKRPAAPKLVVARGKNRGVQGRPKGVQGKYKMVDSRMKKELRADKRQKKASKKKRR